MNIFSRLSEWFRSHWQVSNLTPEMHAHCGRQQTLSLASYLRITDPSNTLVVLVIIYFLHRELPLSLMLAWGVGTIVVCALSRAHTMRVVRQPNREHPTYRQATTIRSTIVALLFACFYGFAFSRVNAEGQILIVALFLVGLGGGVIALSPHPPAGVAWILTFALVGFGVMVATGSVVFITLGLLLLVLGLLAFMWLLAESKSQLERICAKLIANEQRDLTDLLLRDFEGAARDWLWEADQYGRLCRLSEKVSSSLRRSEHDLKRFTLPQLIQDTFKVLVPEAQSALASFERKLSRPVPFRNHLIPITVEGELRWWSMSARPLIDSAGKWIGWRGVGSDTTDTARREQDLVRLANVDSLTGLASRHQFQTAIHAFDLTDTGVETGLLLIDLDNFKSVNDKLGHAVGDLLLQQVAQRLASKVRADDLLARLGGDEYALIVRNLPGLLDLRGRGRELVETLNEPFIVGGARIEARGSVGVACAPYDATDAETLMRVADVALYSAKDAGRNCVVLYDSELARRTLNRTQTIEALASAVESQQLYLVYQPQVDTRSGSIIGYEALVRWARPDCGLVPPGEFIALAEETGLIIKLGVWVLHKACNDALQWPSHIRVAVNLSASQFVGRSLIDDVAQALASSGLDPKRLELEITESALIEDRFAAGETLRKLRNLGVRVAIDDFGTGYSSLSYLGNFPLDHLKIDRSFVTALELDPTGRALTILTTILQLARNLGLESVAEGVETQEQLRVLRQNGCDALQGYCIARPMRAEMIESFSKKWEEKLLQ